MRMYENNQQKMNYLCFGTKGEVFIWAHGWGQSHDLMRDLAETLGFMGMHYIIDFPGFGASPQPERDWTVGDYADFMAEFIASLGLKKKVIWVGHSFGSRVGLKLAATFPDHISHLILIAAPGLPRRRSLYAQIMFRLRIWLYKILKFLIPIESARAHLRGFFGSSDYKNAGPMRTIFMNVIREDLGETARTVKAPTLLIYGQNDNETPPEIGMRLTRLIPHATIRILADFDHYSVLTSGKHQTAQLIKNFIGQD